MENKNTVLLVAGAAAIGAGIYFMNKGGGGGGGGENTFKLNTAITPAGAGSVSVSPPGGVYYPGDLVLITAHVAPGYAFDHWVNSDGTTSTANPQTIFMPARDLTVQAVCVPTGTSGTATVNLAVSANPVYNYDPLTLTITIINNEANLMVFYAGVNVTVGGISIDGAEFHDTFQPHESRVYQLDVNLTPGNVGSGMAACVVRINSGTGIVAGTAAITFTVLP